MENWCSIRVNTLKVSREELKERLEKNYEVNEVPWYDVALLINGRNLTSIEEYKFGYFYIQSLASMLPVIALDPQPGDYALDLAAAPGSKTTQIAMHMQNQGMLIANDSSYLRLKPLRGHLYRLGIICCKITNYDGRRFPSKMRFNRILLDAPCSGLGSHHAHSNYSPNRLNQMAKLQKELLIHAYDLLLPGGRLVYSTCTTRKEENEDVVRHLLNKRNEANLVKPNLSLENDYNIGSRVKLDEFFFIAQIEKP